MISACCYCVSVSENLENSLIRLHIIAQSDSDTDQKIKLAVRDKVLAATTDIDITDTDRFVSVATDCANLPRNSRVWQVPFSAKILQQYNLARRDL